MNRITQFVCRKYGSVPRAHGDEPLAVNDVREKYCVFPVPTGMNRVVVIWGQNGVSVPRAHGDEPNQLFAQGV